MVDKKPRVSIGLPVYNGERYLEQTISNILNQTYQDFELIIGDNASTDRTQEICQKFAAFDPRIKYFRNETNIGAAPNHNYVYQLSNGEYFKWIGYDDWSAPEFVEKCVSVLDKYPDVVLCMPNTRLIDENGDVFGDYDYVADTTEKEPHKRFRNLVLNNETGNHVYGLIRSEVIAQTSLHGSYPSSDMVFLAELSLFGPFHIIPERLFYRRDHTKQSTKGEYKVERDRVLWFDTSLMGKIVLPKWQYLFGYLKAIQKSPLTLYQRLYCYIQIICWMLNPPHFRALGKDVLLAIQKIFIISFSKLKGVF